MYNEDDFLMLSALQHLLFCKRQCALIHIEQLWLENRLTAEGRLLHERVHKAGQESRKSKRVEYDLPLRSLQLGLTGRADVVEFYKEVHGWQLYPVEYKRGKPKSDDSDRVQLCAQALCLEEMMSVNVEKGALFYGKNHRRMEVVFDSSLRQTTQEAAQELHELFNMEVTPKPQYSKKCQSCSFESICLPRSIGKKRTVSAYLDRVLQ